MGDIFIPGLGSSDSASNSNMFECLKNVLKKSRLSADVNIVYKADFPEAYKLLMLGCRDLI